MQGGGGGGFRERDIKQSQWMREITAGERRI